MWKAIPLLFPVVAFANGETLYVRPSGDCANNGNGRAFACAASAGATGAWNNFTDLNTSTRLATTDTVGKVDPGDTLCVIGSHMAQLTYGDGGGAGLGSGSAGLPITIDFDCAEGPGRIDPPSNVNYAFYSEQHHLVINEPKGSGPTNLGNIFYFPSNAAYLDRQITINGGAIEDCIPKTGESCLALYGNNITVDGLQCDPSNGSSGGYCVLTDGKNITVKNTVTTDALGTCLVMDNTVDDSKFINNTCTQVAPEGAGRSCFEINDQDSVTTPAYVIGNTCTFNYTVSDEGSIYAFGVLAKNAAYILGNRVTGGTAAVSVQSSGNELIVIAGNKFISQQKQSIALANSNVQVYNNTVVGDGTNSGIYSFVTGTNVIFRNNILKGNNIGIEEVQAGSTNVDSHNDFYSNTTNLTINSVSTALGTGSITTDPTLDANYDIGAASPAWNTGTPVYPHRGQNGKCVGSIVNIGATCANPVPYGYTLKPKRRH